MGIPLKLLLVEDLEDEAELTVRAIRRGGYDVTYERVETAEDMRAAIDKKGWDLIISDHHMPLFTSAAALDMYKNEGLDVPFIMVSGTIGEEQAADMMRAGAHDYVNKGNLTRLTAAIDRELRETQSRRDRRRMERQLLESEARFRSIIETTNEWVWTVNIGGKLTYCNPAVESILGYTPGELLGREGFSFMCEEDREKICSMLPENVAEKRGWNGLVIRWKHKDGSSRWLESNGVPILDQNGELQGFHGADRDITGRILAEERIKEAYAKLEHALDGVVGAASYLMETRDPYTAGHQRRVALLSCAIGRAMGLSETQVIPLRLAGMVHDAGKISIPAEILMRPGKLSQTEYQLIKTHPQVGYDAFKDVDFPWPIAEMVYQHHERLDGSGYPRGLKNGDLLPEALILGVADVVETMASHRPYRPSLGIPAAVDEISRNRGKLYASEVVSATVMVVTARDFSFD